MTPLAALALTASLALQPAPDSARAIGAVRFLGNASLDRAVLLGAIRLHPPRCRSPLLALPCALADFSWAERLDTLAGPTALEQAAARIDSAYSAWGYPDAEVAASAQQGARVAVVFDIEEGEPVVVSSLAIESDPPFDPPLRPAEPLPLRPGEPLAVPLLEASQRALAWLAAERGYPWAQVISTVDPDTVARTAAVVLRVERGTYAQFGPVQLLVAQPLTPEGARAFVTFEPGEAFDPEEVNESIALLGGLPIVADARAEALAQPGSPVVPIALLTGAEPTHGWGLDGTLSSTTCLSLLGGWRHRHFLRGPRTLSVTGEVSHLLAGAIDGFPCSGTGDGEFEEPDWSIQAELWQPTLFGDPRLTLTLGLFTERWSVPSAFIRAGTGVRIQVGRVFDRSFAARVGWRPERGSRHAAGVLFCASYGACDARALDRIATDRWLAPVEVSAVLTSETPPGPVLRPPPPWALPPVPRLEPSRRFSVEADVDVAAPVTGSEFEYLRLSADGDYTRLLGRTAELAARIQVGGVLGDGVLPPDALLFPGGIGSIRAAGQNTLGPAVLLADSVAAAACPTDGGTCATIDPDRARLRPLGATRFAAVALEARLWLSDRVQLAAFVEAGVAARDTDELGPAGRLAEAVSTIVAPGIGVRLVSPFGPVRLDVAYDTRPPRTLPVLSSRGGEIALLGATRWAPYTWDAPSTWTELRRRLRLWIGFDQPF